MKTNEDSLRDLWDNIKCAKIHIIGVPEGEERDRGAEKIFEEIIAKNFPNMEKEQSLKSRKHRESNTGQTQGGTCQHTLIKLTKIKDKENIKATTEKQQITYKETPVRLSADFFSRNSAGQKGPIYLQ